MISSELNESAVRLILQAAEEGVATMHKEILPSEVTLVQTLFASPLCEVAQAKWRDVDVALKIFDIDSISFEWKSFYRERTQ